MTKLPLGMLPRGLTREQAAEYVGCESLGAFDTWVRKGIVPGPMLDTHRWDRKAIDRWLDKRSGIAADDPDQEFREWCAYHDSKEY